MNVIGLTPIDSSLSAWGLNVAGQMLGFFFNQTHLGLVGVALGFLWSVWQLAQGGSVRPFIVFSSICIVGYLLMGLQVEEGNFKSALENVGTSVISSQSLKRQITNLHTVPLFLSYFSQKADQISIDLIKLIDDSVGEKYQFLENPFGLQKLSLEANRWIHTPIKDPNVREEFDHFIYSQYLPSLIISKNEVGIFEGREAENFRDRLISLPEAPWAKVKDYFQETGSAGNSIDQQIALSFVHGQISKPSTNSIWPLTLNVISFFPYVMGWANFCLYVSFPIIMIVILIFRHTNTFLKYLEIFVWIKSWIISSAIAHYISMIILKIQDQDLSKSWFWEYPYYSVMAAIILCIMPILTYIGINKGFQTINNRLN